MPKFGRKVSNFICDSHTSFKVKRFLVFVLPDRFCILFFSDTIKCDDDDDEKVKGQGHKLTSYIRLISASS